MTRPVQIVRRARLDIEAIFDWLERRSPQGAATWYEKLSETIRQIAMHPEARPLVAETSQRWNRKLQQSLFKTPRGRWYRIIFEATELELLILRVRGPGQRPLRRRDIPTE